MNRKNADITIHSSAAEYLTFIAASGDDARSFEMRYQDENIWLTQKMMATLYDVASTFDTSFRTESFTRIQLSGNSG